MNKRSLIGTGVAFALVLSLSLTTRSQAPAGKKPSATNTIPRHRDTRVKNFDDAMQELEKAARQLETQFKTTPSIPTVEADKIRSEVERGLKALDSDKMQRLEASVSRAEMEKLRTELARIREVELPRMEIELKDIKPRIERELAKAKLSLDKAREEIKEYKAFETRLAADGLINKEDYTLSHKDGVFIINGKTQPQEVYNKYREFLEAHKNFTWKKKADGLDIHNDD